MGMSKLPKRKPRVLRGKNIKRRTGDKAQSKQIMALSKQVSSLTRRSYDSCATKWIRNNLSVETAGGAGYAYICPIPYAPCNPTGAATGAAPTPFTDNLSLASQPTYTKQIIFGISQEAQTSNEIHHTGGKIRYQLINSEPSLTKLGLFLIRPKKKLADQLIKDRLLKQGSTLNPTLGFAGFLNQGLDYEVHNGTGGNVNTMFGSQINTKYWDVLYKREITMGHANATGFTANVNPANTRPANNSIIATGTIKLPAGGVIKNSAVASQTGLRPEATGWEVEYGDQTNENSCYLVCINNGAKVDGETITLGFMATDYYKVSV